jgi:hypothetical protein
VGALAIAGASAANAATVQITFTGSYISTTGGNHIVTDFGGDGSPNVVGQTTSGGDGLLLRSFPLRALPYGVIGRAFGMGLASEFNLGFVLVRE